MSYEVKTFYHTEDNHKIFYRNSIPSAPTNNVIIIIHGWGEHSGCHKDTMQHFCKKGYAVYVPDLRGHGLSTGQRGHVNKWHDYLTDISTLMALINKQHPKNRLFIIGHSMGGLIVLNAATHAKAANFRGVVLMSPLLSITLKVNPVKEFLGNITSSILPRLSFSNKISTEKLTSDPEAAKSLVEDKLCHCKVSAGWFGEMNRALESVPQVIKQLKTPTAIFHGKEDAVTSAKASENIFNNIPVKKKQLILYDTPEHCLLAPPNANKVYSDIHKWLQKI